MQPEEQPQDLGGLPVHWDIPHQEDNRGEIQMVQQGQEEAAEEKEMEQTGHAAMMEARMARMDWGAVERDKGERPEHLANHLEDCMQAEELDEEKQKAEKAVQEAAEMAERVTTALETSRLLSREVSIQGAVAAAAAKIGREIRAEQATEEAALSSSGAHRRMTFRSHSTARS